MKLRLKINVAILLTFIIIAVIYAAILYPFEKQRRLTIIQQINFSLAAIIEQKKDELADELFGQQKDALKITLDELLKIDGIIFVSAYNPDGSLFLSTDDTFFSNLLDVESKKLDIKKYFLLKRIGKISWY